MGEIKFRVWCITNNKMKDRVRYANRDGGILYCPDYESDDNYILMQYTGLKDKNGKGIYEGDVITNGLVAEQVIFSKQAFRLKTTEPEKFSDEILYFVPTTSFEIIGNIYENSDLLNKD